MTGNALDGFNQFFKTSFGLFIGLFKIIFYVTLFLVIVFLVLGNIGGSNDNLRMTIENYASDATGYTAKIETLNNFKFFPTIVLDFEGLTFEDPQQDNTVVASAGHVDVRMGFFSAILGQGRIKALAVDQVKVSKDIVTTKPIALDMVKIEDPDPASDSARLAISGKIGQDALKASVGISAFDSGTKRTYGLGDQARKVNASLGDLSLAAQIEGKGLDNIKLRDIVFKQGTETVLSGQVDIADKLGGRHVGGDVAFGKASRVKPDITIDDDGKITGDLVFPQVAPHELTVLSGAVAQLQDRMALKSDKPANSGIDLTALNMDVTLDLQKILLDSGKSIGSQTVDIVAKDGMVKASSKGGTIADAKTNWVAELRPLKAEGNAKRPHDLVVDFKMDKLSVARALEATGKTSNMVVSVDGAATLGATISDWDDLPRKLNGQVTLVTQEGRFESRWLNLWGDGLTSLILPSLKPSDEAKLNCGVVDNRIKDGIATFETLYMDGQHVRLVGEGSYDMVADNLKMRIKPQGKGISIGDISAAVKIRGPLSKPSVSPDVVDTGKKAVGLLLGSVNPALLALGSTNIAEVAGLAPDKIPDLCPVVKDLPAGNKAASYVQHVKEAAKTAEPAQ